MKIKLLLFLLCFAMGSLWAQQDTSSLPQSWSRTDMPTEIITLAPLDLQEIYAEDAINDRDKSKPYRYGIERTILIDVANEGVWSELENGDRIWSASILSRGALNLSVNFNDLQLPEGTSLHIFNEDRSDVTAAFSSTNSTASGRIASWFVKGDFISIEYFQPSDVTATPTLEVGSIIHGYRMGRVDELVNGNRGLNDSGDCNYDVNCDIGADFDNKKNMVKKAVALLNLGNGFLCSAALVNNTNQDKKPYLLTANHCLEGSDPDLWVVRFNWMSLNPVCATSESSIDIETNFTMSGAALRASNAKSDFALVELYNEVPASWDISFAGWDRSDEMPEFEIGIHHPNGDIMKISRDDSGATRQDANGIDTWLIGGVSVGDGDGWEIGTTESGSSGSPLFNENGSIIGQLVGGQSYCDEGFDNDDFDIYGRFATSWDYGDEPSSRLSDWLDPSESGIEQLAGLQNLLNTPNAGDIGSLDVYPNPATDYITVLNTRYPNLDYGFYNALGQRVAGGAMNNSVNTIPLFHLEDGVYFLKLTDGDSQASITKKVLVKK